MFIVIKYSTRSLCLSFTYFSRAICSGDIRQSPVYRYIYPSSCSGYVKNWHFYFSELAKKNFKPSACPETRSTFILLFWFNGDWWDFKINYGGLGQHTWAILNVSYVSSNLDFGFILWKLYYLCELIIKYIMNFYDIYKEILKNYARSEYAKNTGCYIFGPGGWDDENSLKWYLIY